jgi:hypothetical protein
MYASRLPSDGTIAHGSRSVKAEEEVARFMVRIDTLRSFSFREY